MQEVLLILQPVPDSAPSRMTCPQSHHSCNLIPRENLEGYLFTSIKTQHRRSEPIRQSAFLVALALLAHMCSRPLFLPVLVVALTQVSFDSAVLGGVNRLAVRLALVDAAAMGQV